MTAAPDWRAWARARGWPDDRLRVFAACVDGQDAAVEHVGADVLVLRTSKGALQRMFREPTLACVARGNAATAHLPEYVPPPERPDLPTCAELRARGRR